jgi:hypothetical protein
MTMTRKKCQKSAKRSKNQSLITAGKISPIKWNISQSEAEIALKEFGIPVLEIKRVTCLKHQVCISYWNTEGKVCSSFFSYRIFERWQKAVEEVIAACCTVEEWENLGDIIQYELIKFLYPVEMANQIWHALLGRWYPIKATKRMLEELADMEMAQLSDARA